jgi:hypothetical protein
MTSVYIEDTTQCITRHYNHALVLQFSARLDLSTKMRVVCHVICMYVQRCTTERV